MVETWRGIYPITSFVLEALGRKRDAGDASALSPEEKTLLTAVEFWAAAAHGTLQQHLRPHIGENLAAAQRAFNALGAVRVVSLLRVARTRGTGSDGLGRQRGTAGAAAAEAVRICGHRSA